MHTVTSKDGTSIAFDRSGAGPALILVDGALCSRSFGLMGPLAPALARHFTVFTYNRRGRGESGDTPPYAVEREVEDLEAMMTAAGGSAFLYGASSGVALALEAAMNGLGVKKLALFQPPYDVEDAARPAFQEYMKQMEKLLAEGRRADAVAFFLADMMPTEALTGMRQGPVWPFLEAMAPTLAYDAAVLGDGAVPLKRAGAVSVPTMVIQAGEGNSSMQEATRTLAQAIPGAQPHVLQGQTLQAPPEVIAPLLVEFFRG